MFLYKAIVYLNSGKHLLEAYNSDELEIDINEADKLIGRIKGV